MPDPWGAERLEKDLPSDDENPITPHPEWETNGHADVHSSLAPSTTGTVSTIKTTRQVMPRRLPPPQALEVWAGLMDLSKGRDKVLKTVQYSFRTYLYVLGLIAGVRPLSKWFTANRKRTQLAVSGLSLTRKCLLLLNPLRPLGALISPEPTSAREFLWHLIDFIGAVCDDVFCLSKLGIMSRKRGVIADRWANRLWFFSTVTGIYGLLAKAQAKKPVDSAQQSKDKWAMRKYLADLVFVSYDVFHLSKAKEPVQCCAGLLAALISTGQLYEKQYAALATR